MDLDRFLELNRPDWERLGSLTQTARSKPAELHPAAVEELVALYQRASSQLSFARDHYGDPALTNELTSLVATANATLYRRTSSPAAGLRRFFAVSFPAAFWHIRHFVVVAALATLIPVAVVGLWLANTEEAVALTWTEAEQAAYVDEEFEAYYSSAPAAQFATEVLINNIQVSFLAFAAGVVLGVGSLFVLMYNGALLGGALAAFIIAGEQPKFWGLILPHGLLELTAVIIAGAAGMTLGWALVAPGDQSRADAFTEAARRSVVVVLGLMLAFVTAGIIEGFITPSPLPTVARVGIGIAVEVSFLSYLFTFGQRAASVGLTGLANEELEGETARAVLSV